MNDPGSQDQYSPEETKRRAEAAIRRAFNTPPKPRTKAKARKKANGKPAALTIYHAAGTSEESRKVWEEYAAKSPEEQAADKNFIVHEIWSAK